jgi:hypothetical protein
LAAAKPLVSGDAPIEELSSLFRIGFAHRRLFSDE